MTHEIQGEPFSWLFTAYFNDGSKIEQTQEDKCLSRTDGTGSCFTDVLERQDDLIGFMLYNEKENRAIMMDLITGNFMVNGVPVAIHDQDIDPEQHKLRIIYFRENRVERDLNIEGEPTRERMYTNKYYMGWQTTIDGKNYKYTMAVG